MINENDVLRFLRQAEQNDSSSLHTQIPSPPEIQYLYKKLITEEYSELIQSIYEGNDSHILNESLDLIWVVIGYMISRGYYIDGAWSELSRANLSKLQIDPVTQKIIRRADGKIEKPKNWKAADFSPYVHTTAIDNYGGL